MPRDRNRTYLQAAIATSLIAAQLSYLSSPAVAQDTDVEPSGGEKIFALKLQALFAEKCNSCHGDDPEEVSGGLNMLSRASMLRGGESFGADVLLEGNGEKSLLYIVTTRTEEGFEMPPKEAEQLTEEETWWIRDWIADGAPWPSSERIEQIRTEFAEGELVQTSGGLSKSWTNRRYDPQNLWAYRPLTVQQIPKAEHPVDWFINQKLDSLELDPAPPAKPHELIRRLSYGLTGLPPEELDPSLAELFRSSPRIAAGIYAARLMDSEHYGEHFGRNWLDVVRYADSAGFANDYSRPNAWRYRDYVIRSFNEDKPYDQFAREQIAGDEMDANSPEHLIATGFLRMGPWEQTGMSVFRVTRQQWLDDVTDSVGQTFLGHALQCCKCHDHKFDPIPTRDYYSMMAVFSTTQFAEADAPFLATENQAGFDAAHHWTKTKIAAYVKQRAELNARVAKNKKSESGDAKVGDNGLDPGDEASLARMQKNISRHTWELDKTKPIAFGVYTGKTIERKNVGNRLRLPQNPWKQGFLEDDTILTGGDAFTRGDPVSPAPLSAAASLGEMPQITFPSQEGKRRLALANWILDERNPLTARVIVNRVWSWHFGVGIAGNPNNFGATGSHPTHPKLLDFLADWFMQSNWSVKQLNELIVTSEAYCRSSRHLDPALLAEKDSTNTSYAVFRPRRLTAEEFRDSMLAVSGELNRQVGGIPCRPDINMEVAMQPRQIMGGTASVYEPDPLPSQRNRRSVYAEKTRGLRDPFLEAFNQPGPDKSCEMRETSIVAPQALTLFNATEVQDRALAMADRLMKQDGMDETKIAAAFRLALGREALPNELAHCLDHWAKAVEIEASKVYEKPKFSMETQRTVMAEKTGEPYNFVEIMPAYDSYVPDLHPSNTDAKTRGLSQVCLVIFNLNEFAYLD